MYGLVHTQFLVFSNTLLCTRNFYELVILCVMLLCPNNLVHCYRNVRETQWTPNKPKARRLWPTYRLTSVSVNTPSNSSPTQSQTKIVGHFNQTLFFSFSCSPCLSQSCLSWFGHQILYTNIEGTRRPQSVPTILTETVALDLFRSNPFSVECVISPLQCVLKATPEFHAQFTISAFLPDSLLMMALKLIHN